MKYTGYFLVAMLIATAACAKVGDYAETGNADGDEPAGDGRISFVLPQADNVVTYTAASAEEGGSASDDVVIYAFSPSLKFEQSYRIPYSGGTNVDGGRQYSITMQGSGKHNFVFFQAPASYPFPQLAAGSTLGALTDVLTPTANGRLSPPFVMSNAQVDGKPYITVEDIENQAAPVQVSMKNRVARIDLEYNDSEYTILGVEISNAAPDGRMFDNDIAPTAPSEDGLTYSLAAGDLTNSDRSFYLYPTVLGAGATGTAITIRARLKGVGEDITFTVMTGIDVAIEAGRLYRLSIDPGGIIISQIVRVDFPYITSGPVQQTFTAPVDGVYTLEAWGAQGSSGTYLSVVNGAGGLGGYSLSRRTMKAGETLYIYVGNGGGGSKNVTSGGRGGGATDFRTAGGAWDDTQSLAARILVAGGGGGDGGYRYISGVPGSGGDGGAGGGGIYPGGDGNTGGQYGSSLGGTGGGGGRNNGGSPTGGANGLTYTDDPINSKYIIPSGIVEGGYYTIDLYGAGGGGGGGYGGGGCGGLGGVLGVGGAGGGGGGSYGASDGASGVNAGAARARITYRIRP
jgi:hypothetical protein